MAEDWIGKVPAPADSPAEILSDVSRRCMPGEGLTIEAFLQHVLPVKTYSVVQVQAKECFSRMPPNASDSDVATALVSRTLPSQKLVENLVKEFRQAVLDGMESVVDPDYPDSRLPFWGITFWSKNWEFHAIQETWRKGLSWLNNQLQTGSRASGPFAKACRYTAILRWNETASIPGANRNTTCDFASFLSNDTMMMTTQIDMMFSDLSDRIESVESYVRVETSRFGVNSTRQNQVKTSTHLPDPSLAAWKIVYRTARLTIYCSRFILHPKNTGSRSSWTLNHISSLMVIFCNMRRTLLTWIGRELIKSQGDGST